MTTMSRPPSPRQLRNSPHGRRLLVTWLILSLAAGLLIWFAWKPHLPPARHVRRGPHQQFDIAVLAFDAAPVIVFAILYFVYRARGLADQARVNDAAATASRSYGPHQGPGRAGSSHHVIVMWLFVSAQVELVTPAGAGAGEGPSPIWKLAGTPVRHPGPPAARRARLPGDRPAVGLDYRYPQFGGMESSGSCCR